MYHLLRPRNGFDHRNSRKLFLLYENLKKVCKVSKENFDRSCRFIRFKYGNEHLITIYLLSTRLKGSWALSARAFDRIYKQDIKDGVPKVWPTQNRIEGMNRSEREGNIVKPILWSRSSKRCWLVSIKRHEAFEIQHPVQWERNYSPLKPASYPHCVLVWPSLDPHFAFTSLSLCSCGPGGLLTSDQWSPIMSSSLQAKQ